jgi:hypothetical protein
LFFLPSDERIVKEKGSKRVMLKNVQEAKVLLDRFATIRPTMQSVLDKLKDVPTDINPSFPLAQQLYQH